MAAYAALVSLMHIIEQIQNHPRPPFHLDQKHAQCLIKKIAFLQDFLELYSHVRNDEIDRLESRILEVAYVAEDLIETHVVDQVLAQSAQHGKRICSADFYQTLQKVIQDMGSINHEVMEIKERMGSVKDFQQHRISLMPAADSSRSHLTGQNYTMMGCDDALEDIMDKLTRKQHSNLQVIPIVGMGGIGKTTLAKNVYENPFIVQHFYIRVWATISQEYSLKKILLELLLCLNNQDRGESLSELSEVELRDRLRKSLFGKTYLIILDDIWSVQAWDKVRSSFPDTDNGSRVIITTRQLDVALELTSGHRDNIIKVKFLNDDISWNLLCKIVFGSEDNCPLGLKEIGRKIAKNCQGLPLSIVVIGGLLAMSKKTLEYWKYIAKNSHSLDENERCLNVLYTSYNHLPVHLKPCFLYMGLCGENAEIDVLTLTLLWDAEGFLKPINGKSSKEVAAKCLKDLVDRNLILVEKRDHNGKIQSCKIHDLLEDLCLKEIEKERFFLTTKRSSLNNTPQGINTQRRVSISDQASKEVNQYNFLPTIDALRSASLVRTLIWHTSKVSPYANFRLLRVLIAIEVPKSSQGNEYSLNSYISQLVNLRCIVFFVNLTRPFFVL